MIRKIRADDTVMALKISAVVCEHGNLYVRFHDGANHIFAAGVLDRNSGFKFIDQIMTEFSKPSGECGGRH